MNDREKHTSWLLSCPCNDCNFKSHLKQAYARDIADIIDVLPQTGNKSKIAALKRELKHRTYEVNTFKPNGVIETSEIFTDYYKALDVYNSIDWKKELVERFFTDKNKDTEYELHTIMECLE